MLFLIKCTVKDLQSPSVFKVHQDIDKEVKEYKVQEDVEQVIQQECKVCFSLAHSAPTMTTLLGK
jgi:hypothetical protein